MKLSDESNEFYQQWKQDIHDRVTIGYNLGYHQKKYWSAPGAILYKLYNMLYVEALKYGVALAFETPVE